MGADGAGEGVAAFAFVFAGCGAIVTNAQYHGAPGSVGISLVFGLIITVMVCATGPVSGAQINPSATIAFTLTRHFLPRDAIAYIAAQLTGATLAAWCCSGCAQQARPPGRDRPTVAAGSAFLYEAILTAFLMFVIMAVATDTRGRRRGGDRDRRRDRTRRAVRRPRRRRLDEPGTLIRAGAGLMNVDRVVGLRRRPILGPALGAFAYQLVRGTRQPQPPAPELGASPTARARFVCRHDAHIAR